jgi:hypothetical protein
MILDKVDFSKEVCIWKTSLNLKDLKSVFLEEAINAIESDRNNSTDSFLWNFNFVAPSPIYKSYRKAADTAVRSLKKLDSVIQVAINLCNELYAKDQNMVYADAWINRVRSPIPIQDHFHNTLEDSDSMYHNHVDLLKKGKKFYPHYTWVYYIQMPDVTNDDDGVLYLKGEEGKRYKVKPEEDELIIMPAWLPHYPASAPSATTDRIVLAGNVGFEHVKKTLTLF